MESLNRILSDYPQVWPTKPIALKQGEIYDLLAKKEKKEGPEAPAQG